MAGRFSRLALFGAWTLLSYGGPASAAQVRVAVATNFAGTLDEIGRAFTAESGHTLLVSSASTGKLYAQIGQGAPFEVFLAADAERPRRLEEGGRAVPGSRFTYALGRLVLWSVRPGMVDRGGGVLRRGGFRHLAIANPKIAPYGAAARQVLEKLGVWQAVEPKLVQGEDVGQTLQFVASGAAELGFVALSQIKARPGGSSWVVPESFHRPIAQQAVLLREGETSPAARAFLDFLRGARARRLLADAGYGVP